MSLHCLREGAMWAQMTMKILHPSNFLSSQIFAAPSVSIMHT